VPQATCHLQHVSCLWSLDFLAHTQKAETEAGASEEAAWRLQ